MDKQRCLGSDLQIKMFLSEIAREELRECPRSFMKAVRVTLVALGYNEEYINGHFRDVMEQYYNDYI